MSADPDRILAVSEELARTLDEEPDLRRIGPVLMDATTGEVLEWPEDVNMDRFDWFTFKAVEAERNIDGWKQALTLIKLALARMLTEAAKKSLPTPYGTPRWAQRDNSQARVERVPEIAKEHELNMEALLLLYGCASRLSVPRLRALVKIEPQLAPAVADLIEEGQSKPWIQVDAPRTAAPEIEKVES